MNNNIEKLKYQEGEKFDFKKEISYYLFFWPWFLLVILMSLIGSYAYLRYTPNVYESSAQLQITKSDATSS
ncbi:hypothetical protein N9254_08945, partial [Flavobacteriaceae bacterium]|nr:hypothetical protein [Flavobacteriaceae bacterium]